MDGFGDKKLADYLLKIVRDFENDHNTIRMLRRIRIKQVHLKRRHKKSEMFEEIRRLI